MRTAATVALVLALGAGSALAEDRGEPAFAALAGHVSDTSIPLALSKVYAYHLSDQRLTKVVTDDEGNFRFDRLPAGLYKIIAFKDGFTPAIALLTRSTLEAYQYLDMKLVKEEPGPSSDSGGFWSVREKIPSDVLRDIEVDQAARDTLARSSIESTVIDPYQLDTEMQAVAGMGYHPEVGEASLAGGRVGVQGEIANFYVGLTGDYVALQRAPGSDSTDDPSGRTQAVSLRVESPGSTGVQVSTVNNYMTRPGVEGRPLDVGLERHQVSWSRNVGSHGRSDFTAEYAEESNFFRQAPIEPFGIPEASKSWEVEGSYSTSPTRRSTVQTGFRYREREALFEVETRHARESLSFVPAQRVELFGRGGVQVNPNVLVEFGLYSALRDGSLSLSPAGGMVMRLGDNWRASASGSFKVHDEVVDTLHPGFTPALFGQYESCQNAEEYCYRLSLERGSNELEDLSVGVVHRRFAETLHLYFNEEFFSRLESLYLVRGDNLPEVQFAATRRLTPRVLARLSSNLAAGGGGVLYATDQTSYENEVRYLVTSVDTQFEQTSTGLFVAFHHLAQQLNPVEDAVGEVAAPEMELDRLQVMLTQDLDLLHDLASNWAVHLNMELSRGTGPETEPLFDDEEIRKRVMGGFTVSF